MSSVETLNGKLAAPRITSPAPRSDWDLALLSDHEALLFQEPVWMDALTATGQYTDASRLYEFSGGRRLLLPLARRRGLPTWLVGDASMPEAWGMGGLLGLAPLRVDDVAAVFADLIRRTGIRTTIRPNPLLAKVWRAAKPGGVIATPRLAHVLNLEGGFEKVWSKRFAGEARTAVRKAERSGLEVRCDRIGEDIPVFYELFLRSIDRWAAQQHEPPAMARSRALARDPIEKFYAIARAVGRSFHLWTAWKDNQPAAAVIVLQGRNASYTRGAMDKDIAGPLRANQLLHRLAIEEACKAGAHHYHMGETGTSTSLAQFKTRFGALPVEYDEYVVEKFPVTTADQRLRALVKAVVGFKDYE
jgi:hypothetical protein